MLLLDDLALVRRAKTEAPRTRVILYVAEASPETLLAATIAGADGVVDKAADTHELLLAPVRAVRRKTRCRTSLRPCAPVSRRGWIRVTGRSS